MIMTHNDMNLMAKCQITIYLLSTTKLGLYLNSETYVLQAYNACQYLKMNLTYLLCRVLKSLDKFTKSDNELKWRLYFSW